MEYAAKNASRADCWSTRNASSSACAAPRSDVATRLADTSIALTLVRSAIDESDAGGLDGDAVMRSQRTRIASAPAR